MIRPLGEHEAEDAVRRAQAAFGATSDDAELLDRMRRRIAGGTMFAFEDADGTVLAQARLWIVDHWFGRRRVPCQHVAAVAVAPEHRGRGAARALMTDALRQAAAAGAGLSVLFPATTALYRRLGYEHAGHFARYRLAARHAPATGPSMRAADLDADWPAILACAEAVARGRNGQEVRDDERWDQLRRARFAYVHDAADGGVDGYVLVNHFSEPGDWQYVLDLVDWGANSSAGLAAIAAFVGRHGSLGKAAQYVDGVPTELAPLVAEQDIELRSDFWWMARAVDLPAAVAARGFPEAVAGAVSFTVPDALLPAASEAWRLEVSDGRGTLEPTGARDARVHLDVRAFGPLYTGFRTAESLALAGLLTGPRDTQAFLTTAFSGPRPRLTDFF